MKKRRGFTLSELLVVVVIIGVLSAVVLPKFSKVIETRKTTEAEELMSAVRTEQEARCTLSKKYADVSTLGSYRAGKNFSYGNENKNLGMIATANNNKYKLEMPSYADGRICCSDIETGACSNLNKNYPLCSELKGYSDYKEASEDCGIEIEEGKETPTDPEEPECVSGTTEERQCSNNCGETGTQKNQCIGGKWQGWGACSVSDKTSCGNEPTECGEKPASERDCGCGYKQYSWWKCDETTNYQWEIQTGSNVMGSGHSVGNDGWTPCAKPSGSRRAECPDLQVGSDLNANWIKAYTYEDWNDDTCQWELRDSECCQKHNDKNEACTDGKKGTGIVYEWHYPTCRYVVKSSDCYTTKKVWAQETYRDSITRRSSDCGGCLEDHHGTYICNSEKAKAWWDSQSSHYPEDTYPMCSDIGVSAGMSAENYSGPTTCVLVKASYQGCGTTSTGWGSQTGSDVGYVWPDGHTTRNIYVYAVIKRQYTVLYVTEKVVK